METSTLRPGLLVSIKTTVTGNVKYQKVDVEPDHPIDGGGRQARWETQRTIADAEEHEAARKVRNGARSRVAGVCVATSFGDLCTEDKVDDLAGAIAEARTSVEAFNASARITRVGIYVITGRIAPNDREAIRAINSEVRDLLADMESGVSNTDVKAVRDAAARAKKLGEMLSDDAAALIKTSIEAARAAATKIAKSQRDGGAVEVDRGVVQVLNAARGRFLDLESDGEVAAPAAKNVALDMENEHAL